MSSGPGAPVRWAPDGRRLAVLGRRRPDDSAERGFIVAISGSVVQQTPDGWDVRGLAWLKDQPIMLARPASSGAAPAAGWRWIADDPTPVWAASARLTATPTFFFPTEDGVASVVGGALWSVTATGNTTELSAALDSRVQRVVWPDVYASPAGVSDVIVSTEAGSLYRIATGASAVAPERLSISARGAPVIGYSAQHRTILAAAAETAQPSLLRAREGSPVDTAIRLNVSLGGVAMPERRRLSFRGPSGDTLTAALLTPPRGTTRGPLPLIVSIYGGQKVEDLSPPGTDLSGWPATSLLPYAATEYAVLVPSIPLAPEGVAGEPCHEITASVTAAVDAAVAAGIADSTRVALHGHSYGGYNVFCVLRESDRFKAAVVLAGFADLASLYSAFPPRSRLLDAPHRDSYLMTLAERGQLRMGAPPWADVPRYVRNSPLYDVDRIRTPVLILHGEDDYVPVDQAERMFNSLSRLGRDAELALYAGEGHVIKAPANVRDVHRRIHAFLARRLREHP